MTKNIKKQTNPPSSTDRLSQKPSSDLLSIYEKVNNLLKPIAREEANVEAEKGETVLTDRAGDNIPELYRIGGKKHSEGGTPLDLSVGSFVFSDTPSLKIKDKKLLKEFGEKKPKTPAELSMKYLLNKDKAVLLNEDADELSRKSALYNMEGKMDKLSKLALVQESMKGFPDGIPKFTYPYLEKNGIDTAEIEAAIQKQALLDKVKGLLQQKGNNKATMQDGGDINNPNKKRDDSSEYRSPYAFDAIQSPTSNFSWDFLPGKDIKSESSQMVESIQKANNEKNIQIKEDPEGRKQPTVTPSFESMRDKMADKSIKQPEPEKEYKSVSFEFGFNPYEKMALDSYLASVHNADQMSQRRNIEESGISNKMYAMSLQDKGDYVAAGSQYGFYRPDEVSGRRFFASSPYASFGNVFSKYGGTIRMDEGGKVNKDEDPRKQTYIDLYKSAIKALKEDILNQFNNAVKADSNKDVLKFQEPFKQFINRYFDGVESKAGELVNAIMDNKDKKYSSSDIVNALLLESQNHGNYFYELLSGDSDLIALGVNSLNIALGNQLDKDQLLDIILSINKNKNIDKNKGIDKNDIKTKIDSGKSAKDINKLKRPEFKQRVVNKSSAVLKSVYNNYQDKLGKDITPDSLYFNKPLFDDKLNFNVVKELKTAQSILLDVAQNKNINVSGITGTEQKGASVKAKGDVYFSTADGKYGAFTANQTLIAPNVTLDKPEEEVKKETPKEESPVKESKMPEPKNVKVPEIDESAPFFTQDKNNLAGALYNLASIKKYYPIYAQAQYTAPTPSFYDYRRQEANIQEAGNLAAKSYQNLLPSQVAASAIASGASNLASQAANVVANVSNQNVAARNQYAQSLANTFNTLSEQSVNAQQDYHNKMVTLNQQYDNARRHALGVLNAMYNQALTNAAHAYNLNLANLDSPFRINPREAGKLSVDREKLKEFYRSYAVDQDKKVDEIVESAWKTVNGMDIDKEAKEKAFEAILNTKLKNTPIQKQSPSEALRQTYPQQFNVSPYPLPTPYIYMGNGVPIQAYGGDIKGIGDKRPYDIVSKVKSILQSYNNS